LLITAFLGSLFALQLFGRGEAALRTSVMQHDPWKGHLFALLSTTLPVLLYFSLMESAARGGTLGKRALGLRVVSEDGEQVSLGRAFLRGVGKFLPWETAHAVYWHWPGWPLDPAPATNGQIAMLGAVWLASGWYLVSLFRKDRRTPYDRLAGTQVVAA
jgi:uncharacterized RDD family membrane protein YckC